MQKLTNLDIDFFKLPPKTIALSLHQKLIESSHPSDNLNVEVDPQIVTGPKIHKTNNLKEALLKIEESHSDHYIYRGQYKRYLDTFYGVVPKMQRWLSDGQFHGDVNFRVICDSLIPSYYRNLNNRNITPSIHHVAPIFRVINKSEDHIWLDLLTTYFREILCPNNNLKDLIMLAKFGAIPGVDNAFPFSDRLVIPIMCSKPTGNINFFCKINH